MLQRAHIYGPTASKAGSKTSSICRPVTASVVRTIGLKLERAEIERAWRKPTENFDAYDYFLRGMACVYRWTREANNEALSLFHRAIERDPDFAASYGMAAECHVWRKANGWIVDRAQKIAEAIRLAKWAVELGKDDAVALCWDLRLPTLAANSRARPESGGGVESEQLGEGLDR